MNFQKTAQKILKTGSVIMPLLVTACAPQTPPAFEPTINPSSSVVGNDPITGGCVWTGGQEKVTYQTAKSDLYQVNLRGPHRAQILASLQGGGLFVTASYNEAAYNDFQSANQTYLGVHIDKVTADPNVASPAKNEFLNPNEYNFAIVAIMATAAMYGNRAELPQVICSPEVSLDGARSNRLVLRLRANVYLPSFHFNQRPWTPAQRLDQKLSQPVQ